MGVKVDDTFSGRMTVVRILPVPTSTGDSDFISLFTPLQKSSKVQKFESSKSFTLVQITRQATVTSLLLPFKKLPL